MTTLQAYRNEPSYFELETWTGFRVSSDGWCLGGVAEVTLKNGLRLEQHPVVYTAGTEFLMPGDAGDKYPVPEWAEIPIIKANSVMVSIFKNWNFKIPSQAELEVRTPSTSTWRCVCASLHLCVNACVCMFPGGLGWDGPPCSDKDCVPVCMRVVLGFFLVCSFSLRFALWGPYLCSKALQLNGLECANHTRSLCAGTQQTVRYLVRINVQRSGCHADADDDMRLLAV